MDNDDDLLLSSDDDQSVDVEEIVIQGFRNVRSRTNYRFRGNAMTTTDAMDIDELRIQVHKYEYVLAHVASVFATISMIARSRTMHSLPIQSLKRTMDYLCLTVTWITCYLEMMYMDIEDRIYYVQIDRPLPENKLRMISDLVDDNKSNFTFWFQNK